MGVQRGAGGARDRRLPRAGDLRGRPRDRLHHRRLRRRPARADAVGGGRAGGAGARRACVAELALLRRRGGRALAETRAPRRGTSWSGARARLGDPRRLLDERRQRLDEQVERGRRVLAPAAGRGARRAARRRDAPAPRPPAAPHRRAARARWRRCATGWRRRCARAGAPPPRHRGGVRQAGGAVAGARARARLQPHPARRRPRRHQRRRRAAGRAHLRARCATAASTPPSTGDRSKK